jgi:SAM-dependent methyltransferase
MKSEWLGLNRLMSASVGPLAFTLSATAPLVMRWFSCSGHPRAANPYFLYSASSAGSLLGLLVFPFFLEPTFDGAQQSNIWALGYGVFLILLFGCGAMMLRWARGATRDTMDGKPYVPMSLTCRLRWLLLAFVPSSLLLSVTQHITTNLAPVPLLWVVPLGLYMLTYVLVFRIQPWPPPRFWLIAQPVLVFFLLLRPGRALGLELPELPFTLLAFFASSMVCHGELARTIPKVSGLTEFYLWLAVGGALGGVFNALVAPAIFDWLAEYPLMLIAVMLLRPGDWAGDWKKRLLDFAIPACISLILWIQPAVLIPSTVVPQWWASTFVLLSIFIIFMQGRKRPFRLALTVFVLIVPTYAWIYINNNLVYKKRSFFGTHTVSRLNSKAGPLQLLSHGTTYHGAQFVGGYMACEPLTYYNRKGPAGRVMKLLDGRASRPQVAVIGLGAGSFAAYGKNRDITFYEIDPVVAESAVNPELFNFLTRCGSDVEIVLGDGRIRMGDAPDGYFDLVVLDAFTSEAVPVHLLTREAVRLYIRKLKPDGLLLIHLTNSHLDLHRQVAAIARAENLHARIFHDPGDRRMGLLHQFSTYALVYQDPHDERLTKLPGWDILEDDGMRAWTDSYSNLFEIMRR